MAAILNPPFNHVDAVGQLTADVQARVRRADEALQKFLDLKSDADIAMSAYRGVQAIFHMLRQWSLDQEVPEHLTGTLQLENGKDIPTMAVLLMARPYMPGSVILSLVEEPDDGGVLCWKVRIMLKPTLESPAAAQETPAPAG